MVAPLGEERFQRLLARSTPMDVAELRRLSPMLILSPHQDDETLGCGGLLATVSALGLRPRVAYLTDGSASHRGSTYWTRERLARLRGTRGDCRARRPGRTAGRRPVPRLARRPPSSARVDRTRQHRARAPALDRRSTCGERVVDLVGRGAQRSRGGGGRRGGVPR